MPYPKLNRRYFLLGTSSFALSAIASSCSKSLTSTNTSASGELSILKVGASPVPAGDVIKVIKNKLAAQAGLNLQIVEFTDSTQNNFALRDGAIDVNLFQHKPFMEDFAKRQNMQMVALQPPIYLAPVGIYSKKHKSLSDIPANSTITISTDINNISRALKLLESNGFFQLKQDIGQVASLKDIAKNPKKLNFIQIDNPQLVRSLDDVDFSVIHGSYILAAGLRPKRDSLALESIEGNPYGTVLTTLQEKASDRRIQKLNELLHTPEVKQFINEKFQGDVIPLY